MNEALEDSLQDLGYLHTLPLRKGDSLLADPLCHYFDVVAGNNDPELECSAWKLFFQDLTTPLTVPSPAISPSLNVKEHGFIKNEEKRAYLIHDFITTETNYVKNLETFINLIVYPIRARSKGTRKSNVILGAYECHQVFMNIEEIHQANTDFCSDLHKYTKHHSNRSPIGLLFSRHLDKFKCYRNFLLGVENARLFHTKEIKHNISYQAFIDRVTDNGNSTVYGYLLLPAERIGHYRVFLQELIKHTGPTDPDFAHLTESLTKIEEIASLHDDYHTNLIYLFQSMLQSIHNCPASLISQQRSLICYIDATEHEMQTLKPVSPVTIFLFTDKIMVVRRPSYELDGLELCGLDQKQDNTDEVSFFVRKTEIHNSKRLDRKLKFRGWIGLNDIEIYQGVPELTSSFILMTMNTGGGSSSPETDQVLENYFQQGGVRLFCLSPPFLDSSPSSPPLSSSPSSLSPSLSSGAINRSSSSQQQLTPYRSLTPFSTKRDDFIKQFGKTKAKFRTSDIPTTYYFWNGHHFYANIHEMSYYHATSSKNDTTLIYTNNLLTDIRSILGESYEAPQTLIVVAPSTDNHYSFFIKSRHPVANIDDNDDEAFMELSIEKHDEFKSSLLTNVIRSDKKIQAIVRHKLSPSPSPSPQSSTKSVRDTFRQLNRRKSISTINKLLTGSVQATGNFVKLSTTTKPQQIQQHYQQQQKQQQQKQRPKSASYYHEPLNDPVDQCYQRISNEIAPRNVPTPVNKPIFSADTLTPTSSFLNYRASVVQQRRQHQEQQQQLISSSFQSQTMLKEQDFTGQGTHTSSSYKPSIHPTQTMSYDIKGQKGDTIEDRVNLLFVALAHEMDLTTSSYQETQVNKSTTPSRHGLARGDYSVDRGITTNLGGSTSSSLANNEVNWKSRPSQEPLLETLNGREKYPHQHHQDQSHSIQKRRASPISSGPSPTTLDSVIAEMEQMKSDFDKRLSQVVQDYEQTGSIVEKLALDLQMKEDELDTLRMKYENSVKENSLLYEAFNSEIDHIFDLATTYQDVHQPQNVNTTTTGDHDNSGIQEQRSTQPTLEAQWRKKLEMTIKERNRWHQTACELARELQDVTAYFDTIQTINENEPRNNNDEKRALATTTQHMTTSMSSPILNKHSGWTDHHGGSC